MVKDSPAKRYAEKLLSFLDERHWTMRPNLYPAAVLQEQYFAYSQTPEFEKEHEAYLDLLGERMVRTHLMNECIDALKRLTNSEEIYSHKNISIDKLLNSEKIGYSSRHTASDFE